MWSGSPLKFEHSQHPAQQQHNHHNNHHHQQQQQQHSQGQGQDAEFNNFHMPPQAMPSTPTHHRRGQSLSAIPNLPRTPNHHQLRPPVFLHSPMQRTNSNGLMGVGDVFASNNNFEDNMAYYSPVMSPGTALESLNEELTNFDLAGFGAPLGSVPGGSFYDSSPMPSPGQTTFPFNNNNNPFSGAPESTMIPSRTASPLCTSFSPGPDSQPTDMQNFIRTPQQSPTRQSFREFVSTPEPSPTHHSNPLKDSLLQARQPSPTREAVIEHLIRTPDPSPTRHSFSHASPHPHGNLLQTAPDLRPMHTPRGSGSPDRSRQSPSPTRRMRAHQRTQSLQSINSVVSLADGDMEQYRVESTIKPEQISELIGETEAPPGTSSQDSGASGDKASTGTDANKKYICKWIEQVTDKDGTSEEKTCGQFFERKENCKAHIQTHLDDRQYKCPYGFCGKLFVRSHDLRRHLRTHDVHKKWVCPCGRDFSRADALHRHQGRGNCIGAPPGTKRKEPAKRGRPPKKKDGVPGATGSSDPNAPPTIVPPGDLSQPPQPHISGSNPYHDGPSFAPMGGSRHDSASIMTTTEDDLNMDLRMDGLPSLDIVDMEHLAPPDLDPSPSPTRDLDTCHSSGFASSSLAPSPLGDDLSPSPVPPDCGDTMLCGPPGDEWLEDLIFINDNFVENGSV